MTITYPPLDTLKPVAENIWVVDSGPISSLGLKIPIRMSVMRLSSGDMLLHSPTRYIESLRQEIEEIGPVRHLIAPNLAHWVFVEQWQAHCPDATVWAAPGLRDRRRVRRSGLRIDRELEDTPPLDWAEDIEQVIAAGGGGFHEVCLFHRASRTLILTDLIENFEPEKLPRLARPAARLAGILAPNGKTPLHLRLLILPKRGKARRAAARLVAMEPERVIFSHGRWFDRDGAERLRLSMKWLIK